LQHFPSINYSLGPDAFNLCLPIGLRGPHHLPHGITM